MTSSFQAMLPSDLRQIRALPGNDQCIECGQENPEWASVSFGTVFCLQCSGIHRSLGTHISFVRSLTMDSWTESQLKLMKCGGNQACQTFLQTHGMNLTNDKTSISEIYSSPPAQLYKQVLKARVEGTPEPTELPISTSTTTTTTTNPTNKKRMNIQGFGSSPPPPPPPSNHSKLVPLVTVLGGIVIVVVLAGMRSSTP